MRRTDKSGEAKFYNIENYMVYVEDWYRNYSLKFPGKTFNKTVYLATDASEVLSEARKKFGIFLIISKLIFVKFGFYLTDVTFFITRKLKKKFLLRLSAE